MPRMSSERPQAKLNLRIPADLKAAFEAVTTSADISADEIIQNFMRAYVEEHQEPEPGHEEWFRSQVKAAMDDPRPGIPHEDVMRSARSLLDQLAAAKLARET